MSRFATRSATSLIVRSREITPAQTPPAESPQARQLPPGNILCMLIVGLALVAGCQKSSSSRVPPPESTSGDDSPANAPLPNIPQPPGDMVLPEQLNARSHLEQKKENASGGFEMPGNLSMRESQAAVAPQTPHLEALSPIRFATWETILNETKQSGRLTVIDLWSLSCQPCMEEFPGLVRLHQELGDQVHCVGVNVDFDGRKRRLPAHYEPRVNSFLETINAGDLPNFICETANDQVYQMADIVSLPSVLIYNRKGKLLKKFVDAGDTIGFGYDKDIRPFIMTMLEPTN